MKSYSKNLFVWQAAGGGLFLLIVSPLLLAVFQYELSDHQISFLQNLSAIYKVLMPPDDIDIFLLNLAISGIGVLAGTLLYWYKKRKPIKELTSLQLLDLIKKGENEQLEFKASLRYD